MSLKMCNETSLISTDEVTHLECTPKWCQLEKNQHQESHQSQETIHDKFVIFAKLGSQKKSIG